ncbi:MAG: SH3 domain-containing protein [Rhizomicrobium sp.]
MKRIAAAAVALLCTAMAEAAPSLHVVGVAAKDTLNLRSSPDAKAAKTGTLAPDASGISVVAVDSKGADWVKIAKGTVSGWVNAKFLAYETGTPVRLTCTGTEPFWNLNVGYGFADFEFNGDKSKLALEEPLTPAARPEPWLIPVRGKPGFLMIGKPAEKCSDGMSDNTYPYSMLVRSGSVFAEGCCK